MGGKTGRTIEAYEKDQRALELRKEGHTYESISEQLGYSTPSASYKAVIGMMRGENFGKLLVRVAED